MEESSFSVPNNNASNTAITTGLSYRRHYRPYYTKRQLLALGNIRRLGSLAAKETSARYSSCKFMQDVGRKLGFPQKTISTSQALYHRFYLYYSIKDYSPQDISIACLFVASKIEETIKKLKDIFVAVHSVKYPDSKELDPEQISEDRKRKILGYEKLVLETICFNFQLRHPYEYIIKFTKWIKDIQPSLDDKQLAKKAYEMAVDSYKTSLCIEYPPHTIAAGCIYLASLFLTEQNESFKVQSPLWDQWFLSRMDDIEDVAQQILDLYIATNPRHDVSKYTRLKIILNEQAQQRGPDPYLDKSSQLELKTGNMKGLDEVNTNQHTVSYHFE
ncbi:hypothetical protein G6F37_011932 [Rhizopus arrhizus]|nr:hypothetical protein G6F37_011932 [Rhizopus arrhizus]KAG1147241.1 hypothetical protein G6F38_004369 [Rhizopus arrhizus]